MQEKMDRNSTSYLKELLVTKQKVVELKKEAIHLPSWDLTQRQVQDVELLLHGAFSPLEGFLTRSDFDSVCKRMRLLNGSLWPIPITLDIDERFAASLSPGDRIALRRPEGMVLANMTVKDIWHPDHKEEAQ